MPRIGWIVGKEQVSPEEAVARAEAAGHFYRFPAPVWRLLNQQTERSDGPWLSPSSAGYCARQRLLKATRPYYLDPQKTWPLVAGAAYHGWFEKGIGSNEVSERWITAKVAASIKTDEGAWGFVPWPVYGTPDLYNPEYRRVTDWKYKTDFHRFDQKTMKKERQVFPAASHETQVNIYAWMCGLNHMPVDQALIYYFMGDTAATREVVVVDLWPAGIAEVVASELAAPLAAAVWCGEMPACTCDLRAWGMDRDLCLEVEQDGPESWLEHDVPVLRRLARERQFGPGFDTFTRDE